MISASTQFRNKSILTPVLAIVSILAASLIGGVATATSIQNGWYATLTKSPLNPPNYVFGPVWTVLYIMIGVSFVVVWKAAFHKARDYKMAFGVQMALNLLWSLVFFGLRSPEGGVVVILAMLAAIIWNIVVFNRYKKLAALLLVPYLAWVSFATYLNISIANLN